MRKSFYICLFLLLTTHGPLLAQDISVLSISELNDRLQKSKADTGRVSLLLKAALVYITRPGMEKNDFDSASFFSTRALDLANSLDNAVWQGRCYSVYSQLYRENNDKEKGMNSINRAISIYEKQNLKEMLGDAYFELQNYYDIYSDSESASKIGYTEMGVHMYQESGNRLKQAVALKHLGDFYQIKEKDSMALDRLHAALAIYKSVQYEQVQGVYDLIGLIHFYHNDYNQALKYGLLAVQVLEKFKTGGLESSTIYNRVGFTYYRLTQYQEAANSFTKSFNIAFEYKDSITARFVAQNVMNSLLRLGKQKELINFLQRTRPLLESGKIADKAHFFCTNILAYLLTNDHRKAAPFALELIRLVDNNNSVYALRSLHRSVIPYYLAAGKYNLMYKYLSVNDSICKKTNDFADLTDNYLWWYKADSALGKQAAAFTHYKLYREGSDSLLRYRASQQINQLMIQHETLKKDQEIASKESNIQILTGKGKLQQEQLRQTKLVRNLTYGLVVLLVITVGLLFNRYRLKQRSNRRLELQQLEINDKNTTLQKVITQKEKLLVEKEWLLKEVHHRVKNNMQIVMSLLNSQSAYIDNEPALTAIHESQHRVHAMSLIHQKLYNSENVSSIEMSAYIRELVTYLGDSFNTARHIRFELDIEPLVMDVGQAVPLGLILNEAITNALKYAFPDKRNGIISISLAATSPHHYLISIADNGIGMPSSFDNRKPGSLGMSLIAGLCEDLEGRLVIENNNGTTIKISFVHELGIKRPDTLTDSVTSNY